MGERARLLANELTDNKDLKDEQTQKDTDKAWWTECLRRWIVIWTIDLIWELIQLLVLQWFFFFLFSLYLSIPLFWEGFYII